MSRHAADTGDRRQDRGCRITHRAIDRGRHERLSRHAPAEPPVHRAGRRRRDGVVSCERSGPGYYWDYIADRRRLGHHMTMPPGTATAKITILPVIRYETVAA